MNDHPENEKDLHQDPAETEKENPAKDELVISSDSFRKSKKAAEDLLRNGKPDDVERVLLKLEKKLAEIPKIGDKLAHIPVLISMVRSFIRKEYTALPIGSAVAALTALIYFLSPVDLIPDAVPVIGYLDDAAVLAIVWTLIESDVEAYLEWRDGPKNS